MRLGIFGKAYDRPDVAGCLQAVADAGIPATRFNLSVAGLPIIPETPVPDAVIHQIRTAAGHADVAMAAISGTFNAARSPRAAASLSPSNPNTARSSLPRSRRS